MENNLVIQTITSSCNIGCKLDLKTLARIALNSEYNERKFNALIMRIRKPRTTALIFSTGTIVCTGAKSENDSKVACRRFTRLIQKLGYKCRFLTFKIHNLVVSIDTHMKINLVQMSIKYSSICSFEPELFPTLNFPKRFGCLASANVSTNGKVVITGVKTYNDAKLFFSKLKLIISEFESKEI